MSEGTQHPGRWQGTGSRGLRQHRRITRGLRLADADRLTPLVTDPALRIGRLAWRPGNPFAAFTIGGETVPLVMLVHAEGGVFPDPPGDTRTLDTMAIARDSEYRHRLLQLRPLADPDVYEAIERLAW
jgi:hypothetical protein